MNKILDVFRETLLTYLIVILGLFVFFVVGTILMATIIGAIIYFLGFGCPEPISIFSLFKDSLSC